MPGPTISAALSTGDHEDFYRMARGWIRELIRRVGSLATEADVGLGLCARWLAPSGGKFEADLIDIRASCTELVAVLRRSLIRCKVSTDFAPYDDAMWDALFDELSEALTDRIGNVHLWIGDLTVPDLSSAVTMPDLRQHELRTMPESLAAHLEALEQCLDPAYVDRWLAENPPA